jgi:hypothetical protein
MAVKLEVKVNVNGQDNISNMFKGIGVSAKVAAGNIKETITAVSTGYLAVVDVVERAGRALVGFSKGSIEAERASVRLATSLKSFGGYSKQAVDSFKEFGDQMERMTGTNAEAVLETVTLAKSFGVTNEQAKKLAVNAAGLAQMLGTDLNSAMVQQMQLLDGAPGRLGKYVKGLQGLTEEQLKSGKGFEVIANHVRQFVGADADTFSGTLTRMSARFGELNDGIADAILSGINLPGRFKDMLPTFESLANAISRNSGLFRDLGSAIGTIIQSGIEVVAQSFIRFADGANLLRLTFQNMDWKPVIADLTRLGIVVGTYFAVAAFKQAAVAVQGLAISFQLLAAGALQASFAMAGAVAVVGAAVFLIANAKAVVMTFENLINRLKYAFESVGLSVAKFFASFASGDSKTLFEQDIKAREQALEGLKTEIIKVRGEIDKLVLGAPKSATSFEDAFKKAQEQMEAARKAQEAGDKGKKPWELPSGGVSVAPSVSAADAKAMADALASAQAQITALDAAAAGPLAELENTYLQDLQNFANLVREKKATQEQFDAFMIARDGKLNKDIQKLQDESTMSAARAAGNTRQVIALEAQKQLSDQQKLYDQGLIDFEEFEKAKGEIARKQKQAESQTSGSASVDDAYAKGTQFIQAAQSGVASTISAIGAQFGPEGQMIAAAINFLNMSKEQFSEMVSALLDAIIMLPVHLVENIPILIVKVIESFPAMIASLLQNLVLGLPALMVNVITAVIQGIGTLVGKLFDVNFWISIAKNALVALTNAFKGFFKMLFTGKGIEIPEPKKKGPKATKAEFGSNLPANAGDAKFKVKDLNATGNVNKTIEETVEDATEQAEQSFGEIFAEMGRAIWEGLVAVAKTAFGWLKSLGKWIWDGVVWAAEMAYEWLKKLGSWIWDGFVGAVEAVWDFLKTMGQAIWQGMIGFAQAMWYLFAEMGRSIWNGLTGLAQGAFNLFAQLGSWIWNGLSSFLNGAGNIFSNLGSSIVGGFKNAFSSIGSWFSDTVGGWFRGPVDKLGQWLSDMNPLNLVKKLFSFGDSEGKVEDWLGIDIPVLKFAQGGYVPGQAKTGGNSYSNDIVPALLSPGEFVLPRSVTGNKAMMAVIEAMTQGKEVQQFFLGGIVKAVKKGVKSAAKSVSTTASNVGSAVKSGASSVWEGVKSGASTAGSVLKQGASFVSGGLSGTVKAVYDFLKAIGGNVSLKGMLTDPVGEAMGAFKGVIKDFFKPKINDVMSTIFQGNKFANGGWVMPHMAFANGGWVPGAGNSDSVPAMLTPGEYVVPKAQAQAMKNSGGNSSNVEININIAAGAKIDELTLKRELIPQIINELRRASKNGTQVLSPNGVY